MGTLMSCVLSPPPPMTFFWVVNIIVTKFVDFRLPSMAVVTNTLWPQLKGVSSRQKGVLYDLDTVYSPGRSRKK